MTDNDARASRNQHAIVAKMVNLEAQRHGN
jgi:hypothetical protein